MMHGRYCLVDEKWIPVAGRGRVSLIDTLFSIMLL